MTWGAAIAAIFTALLPLIQLWIAKRPERKKEEADEKLQEGRKDIADDNSIAVSVRIDQLLAEDGNTTNQPSRPITAGRINSI